MKAFCLIALFALAAIAMPVEDEREHGDNGWYIPQKDGSWIWLSLDEAKSKLTKMEQFENGHTKTAITVTYYLYTKTNPIKSQTVTATTKSIDSSNFNAGYPTRFIIHGWNQSYKHSMNSNIRDAWLSYGDYNIIVVDWAHARSIDYISSVADVPAVGEHIANMIDFLNEAYNMHLDTLEVIGHGLGAHVAGYAGKNVERGQIRTIIGLDPALPLFSYNEPNKRLSSTDAYYVESIQTNGGQLGFLKPIGKGAFYPNGGQFQPGCGLDLAGAFCSHARSVIYYAEAIEKDDFPTAKCSDYIEATTRTCSTTYSSVRMGAKTNAIRVTGDFFVPVNIEAPFGMGN